MMHNASSPGLKSDLWRWADAMPIRSAPTAARLRAGGDWLPVRSQNRLDLSGTLDCSRRPAEPGGRRIGGHRLDQLVYPVRHEHTTIARAQILDLKCRPEVPVLDNDAVTRAADGQAQVVGATAQHRIDGTNTGGGAKQQRVHVPRGGIVLDDSIRAVAALVEVVVVPGTAHQPVGPARARDPVACGVANDRVV